VIQSFCLTCCEKRPYLLEERHASFTVRGCTYTYLERSAYCVVCGDEIYVPEVNDWNVQAREDVYFAVSHEGAEADGRQTKWGLL
jgi:hypothetical protein